MKNVFKNRRRATVGTALGIVLAIGSGLAVTGAVAQTGADTGSSSLMPSSQSAPPYAVLARSFLRYEWNPDLGTAPLYLPGARPNYSQIHLESTKPEIVRTAGLMGVGQVGQLHVDAAVMVKKDAGTGTSQVTCDLRVSGASASNEFTTTISRAGESLLTMALVGSASDIQPGVHNVGIRCWSSGDPVRFAKADMHAVVIAQ